MAREVIPHMKKNGSGKIINIIGTAGKEPNPLYIVPGVTNSALINFTKSLSKELEPDKIFVNSINPGTTDTPLTIETFNALAKILRKTPDEIRQSIVEHSPRGYVASPDDIAKVVVFIASDAANFINGVSLNVDAGKILGLC